MKTTRKRSAFFASAALAAALALSACGSKTADEATSSAPAASEAASASASAASGSPVADAGIDPCESEVKVGLLNSLSGTMAISEVTVRDSLLLAIDEINAAGGVLGKQITPISEDGASDWPTFAEKAQKLITEDKVAAVFGGWTSASRKQMLPVFEANKALLFYPVQYEGLEASPYIFYSGATTNQQIIPALEYLKEQGVKTLYLVGSDYVFPRTANKEIAAWAAANEMEIVGEDYKPLGDTEFSAIVDSVKAAAPDAVFNTLNGDSNVAFWKQYKSAGLTAADTPVMSVSIAEEEVAAIGPEYLTDQLVSWNYYQTTDTPENAVFVKAYQDKYGADKPTSDPMEAAYTSVYLWKEMVEKAGTCNPEAVKAAAEGITFAAPEGLVTMDGENHHIYKTARIGKITADGQIVEVWNSGEPIKPDPFLEGYDWAAGLTTS